MCICIKGRESKSSYRGSDKVKEPGLQYRGRKYEYILIDE